MHDSMTTSSEAEHRDWLLAVLALALLLLLTLISLRQLRPPAVVPADAPPSAFSAERAARYLPSIARAPHGSGMAEHAIVRDHLTEQLEQLGLSPEIQTATVVDPDRLVAGRIHNIVARVPGTASTGAVLLMAHYDSVAVGPGAADDGAGVAAILETLRALLAGPPLRNDLIVLFTDAEEVGLLGSRAFVEQHPWRHDVAVVLNLEARGTSGPALMFETSGENRWLIEALAHSGAPVVASSLMGSVYEHLPNDTDLSSFRAHGVAGLNVAFGGDWPAYHTLQDNLERLDQRSLQHHGEYALALAREFGHRDLTQPQSRGDAVYVSVFGRLVSYPESWALPLALTVALPSLLMLGNGLRRRRISIPGITLGFLAPVLGGVLSLIALTAFWAGAVSRIAADQQAPLGGTYGSGWYALAFVVIALALATYVMIWCQRQTNFENMLAGSLLLWTLLAVALSLVLPGVSFLALWPAASMLLALGIVSIRPRPLAPWTRLLVGLLPAGVGLLLWAPVLALLFAYLEIVHFAVIAAGATLLLSLGTLPVDLLTKPLRDQRRRWPGLGVAAGLLCLIVSLTAVGMRADRPHANSVFYVLDADTGAAFWASSDARVDQWTAQLLTDRPAVGMARDAVPIAGWQGSLLTQAADPVPLPQTAVTVVDNGSDATLWRLRLRIVPPAGTMTLFIGLATEVGVHHVEVDGVPARDPSRFVHGGLQYVNPGPEGVEIILETSASVTPVLGLATLREGLPQLPGKDASPRPADMQPAWAFDNVTVIRQTLSVATP